MEIRVRYPCGYEYEFKTSFFDLATMHSDGDKGCPIHGKKCKRGR